MKSRLSRTGRVLAGRLSLLVLFALGALWAPAPSLADDPEPETQAYIVQPGDTLYRLAVRFGTTVDALVALNDIRDPDLIFVNQVLQLPDGAAEGAGAGTPAGGTPATGGPLSFTWDRVGMRYEGNNYVSKLRITATGGQPPYTYYHDGVAFTGEGNMIEVPWQRGRNKPGSVGVADATGNYVKEDYWLTDTCDYPVGVMITKPEEDAELKTYPRNFNIEWEPTIDPAPDGYWIEIEKWEDGRWRPFQAYRYDKGSSKLFFVPDPFPGDLGGRVRMWGIYGTCEARDKTPWRYFEFRVTY